jgi:hypothetical protein
MNRLSAEYSIGRAAKECCSSIGVVGIGAFAAIAVAQARSNKAILSDEADTTVGAETA